MSAPRGETGSLLVELMVALACTSLLAGTVLSLLADAARVCQERRGRVEARALATAAADLLTLELGRAGHGLEGAVAIQVGGEAVPVLEVHEGGFAVAHASAPAVEVVVEGSSQYGLDGSARHVGIALDEEVAALGAPAPLPVGRVIEVLRRATGDRVTVDWYGVEPATVRALVPLRRRELGLLADGDTWQLRQRAAGGRWQPSVDHLAELSVLFGRDDDGDGSIDGWEVALPGPLPDAVHVRAVARLPSGSLEMAERHSRR